MYQSNCNITILLVTMSRIRHLNPQFVFKNSRRSLKSDTVLLKIDFLFIGISNEGIIKAVVMCVGHDIAPLPAVDAMIRHIDRVLRCGGQHAVCQVHAFPSFPGVLISITYHRPVCKSPTHPPTAFSRRSRPDTGFLSSRNEEKEIKRKSKDIPLLSGENRGT